MKELNLEEKIGQLFLIGIPNKASIPNVLNLIKNNHVSGVILYKNNYGTYQEMVSLVKKLKRANKNNKVPLFISIDQEGGRVNRFPRGFEPILNPYSFRNASDTVIKKRIKIISKLLNSTGINMNFDPVLDLKLMEDNHYIGKRAYSDNPDEVSRLTTLAINEYIKNNIIPVAKHFPGQGGLKADSHRTLPVIRDYTKHVKKELKPFVNAIKNDIPGIMVGHIKILNKTNNKPASISKNFINKEIRGRLKYNNLIIPDELSMRSVRYRYGRKRTILIGLKAGLDLIPIKYYPGIEKIFPIVKKQILNNKINVDNQVENVLRIKEQYKINDNIKFKTLNRLAINKEIKELNKKAIN